MGALLDAEVRIGELTSKIPLGSGGDRKSKDAKIKLPNEREFDFPKSEAIIKLGLKKTTALDIQYVSEHKDLVEEVKKEAKENDDIPTRSEVLWNIKRAKY